MPTLAFHSHYWATATPSNPAGGASSVGGHQAWMVQFGAGFVLLMALLLQRF